MVRWRLSPPVILIVALALLFFGRALLPGKVFSSADILFTFFPWRALKPGVVPGNPLLSDISLNAQPSLIFTAREIRHWRFPLWDPHSFGGAPLLGNAQSALFSPFTWLTWALPVPIGLSLEIVLRVMIAGLGMFWMLRVMGLQRMSSTIGASAFMFNGFLIVWLGWSLSNVSVLLPAILGLTEKLRQTLSAQQTAYLALVLGCSLCGGHPETAFHEFFVMGCYAFYRTHGPRSLRFVVLVALASALGILLAAIQLLPFFSYLRDSAVFAIRQPGVHPGLSFSLMIVLLIPNFFGSPALHNFWGSATFNETSAYTGIAPLILSACAIVGGWNRLGTKFFLAMAVFSIAVVYGIWPLPMLLSTLPGFSRAANHRMLLVLAFSLSALGAFGMEVLLELPIEKITRLRNCVIGTFGFFVGVSLVCLAKDHKTILAHGVAHFVLSQWLIFFALLAVTAWLSLKMLQREAPVTPFALGLVAVEVLSFLHFAPTYSPIIQQAMFYPLTSSLEFLQHDHSTFRVSLPLLNLGEVYDLADISGYDGMSPRKLVELSNATQSLGAWGNAPLRFDDAKGQLADLMNVKYVLMPPRTPSPADKFTIAYDGSDARIFQNRKVFPRAFLVPQAHTCLDDASAIAAIRSGNVDLSKEVFIAGCPNLPSGGTSLNLPTIDVYEPGRVVVSANPSSTSFLVLTDGYDDGWKVTIDGKQAPMLRADHAFRAVVLGPGEHRVEFVYRPLSFIVGAILSLIALCVIGGLIYFGRRSSLAS